MPSIATSLPVFTLEYRVTGSLDGSTLSPPFSFVPPQDGIVTTPPGAPYVSADEDNIYRFTVQNLGRIDLSFLGTAGGFANYFISTLYIRSSALPVGGDVSVIDRDLNVQEQIAAPATASFYYREGILIPQGSDLLVDGYNATLVPVTVRITVYVIQTTADMIAIQQLFCCEGNTPEPPLPPEPTVITPTFLYFPGVVGPQPPNTFSDWTQLAVAAGLEGPPRPLDGERIIDVDDSIISPAPIPAGPSAWDLSGIVLRAAPRSGTTVPLQLADGAEIIFNRLELRDGLILTHASATPPNTLAADSNLTLVGSAISQPGATVPMFTLPSDVEARIVLREGSTMFVNSVTVEADADLEVAVYDDSSLLNGAVIGDGNISLTSSGPLENVDLSAPVANINVGALNNDQSPVRWNTNETWEQVAPRIEAALKYGGDIGSVVIQIVGAATPREISTNTPSGQPWPGERLLFLGIPTGFVFDAADASPSRVAVRVLDGVQFTGVLTLTNVEMLLDPRDGTGSALVSVNQQFFALLTNSSLARSAAGVLDAPIQIASGESFVMAGFVFSDFSGIGDAYLIDNTDGGTVVLVLLTGSEAHARTVDGNDLASVSILSLDYSSQGATNWVSPGSPTVADVRTRMSPITWAAKDADPTAVIDTSGFSPPLSGAPTAATTAIINARQVVALPPGIGVCQFSGKVPDDLYSEFGGPMTRALNVKIVAFIDGDTGGSTEFAIRVDRNGAGDSAANPPTFVFTSSLMVTALPGTEDTFFKLEFPIEISPNLFQPGDGIRLQIARDGTGDGATRNVYITAVEIDEAILGLIPS